jgi:hypothetical protein
MDEISYCLRQKNLKTLGKMKKNAETCAYIQVVRQLTERHPKTKDK